MPHVPFTLQDEEIGVPKYVSPEEQARLEAEAAAEAARQKAADGDDKNARALQQMMYGTVQAAATAAAAVQEDKPAWMSGDPKTFTREQQQEVRPPGALCPIL